MAEEVQVLSSTEGPRLPIVEGSGEAVAVVWPGVGAYLRSMHRIALGDGGRTIRMKHPSEAVYYVLDGSVDVVDEAEAHVASKGAMIFVEPETPYSFASRHGSAVLVGGPCPPDPALYEALERGEEA